jgi:hypothetical protein
MIMSRPRFGELYVCEWVQEEVGVDQEDPGEEVGRGVHLLEQSGTG